MADQETPGSGEGAPPEEPTIPGRQALDNALAPRGDTPAPPDVRTPPMTAPPTAAGPPRPPEEEAPGPSREKPERERITFWQGVREVVLILLLAAVVAIIVQSFFLKAFIIPSASMEPTLKIGDRVMVDRVTYYFRKPRRGDIVVWRYPPTDPRSLNTTNPFYWPFQQVAETLHLAHRGTTPYVKRVIATEGETFQIKEGRVYINGKRIKEPYAVEDSSDFGPVKVPRGMFYGLGDNRPNSRDSRFFGPIPYRAVIGRVFLIWWPPKDFGKPKG